MGKKLESITLMNQFNANTFILREVGKMLEEACGGKHHHNMLIK